MILKLSLKSHFKFFKKLERNTQEKKIFVKEMYIFLMALNGFLSKKLFKIKLIFTKKNSLKINLLKSPIRYKKFFNQVFSEIFFVKIHIFYKTGDCINYNEVAETFFLLDSKFDILGTNLLTKNKMSLCFLNVFDTLTL